MTTQEFRRIALSLPEASEGAHMGHPDFRVGGRVFATLGYPARGWGIVRLTPDQQEWLVRAHPATFAPVNGAWAAAGIPTCAWRRRRRLRFARRCPPPGAIGRRSG